MHDLRTPLAALGSQRGDPAWARRSRAIVASALFLGAAACSHLPFLNDDPEPPSKATSAGTGTGAVGAASTPAPAKQSSQEPSSPSNAALEEQELKTAKLWARVDELEEEQFRQKERIKVLEKGLTLGLLPEELKAGDPPPGYKGNKGSKGGKGSKGHSSQQLTAKDKQKPEGGAHEPGPAAKTPHPEPAGDATADESNADEAHALPTSASKGGAALVGGEDKVDSATNLNKDEQEKYQVAMAAAHDLFRAGRYGRAIVEYSAIGKQYGDKVSGGMHIFWIGQCWAGLKELNTARQHFVDFLKDHGDSPWAPRAAVELAKVEWQLGSRETALQRLRDLIQKHPYSDAAEIAKMELQTLDKKL